MRIMLLKLPIFEGLELKRLRSNVPTTTVPFLHAKPGRFAAAIGTLVSLPGPKNRAVLSRVESPHNPHYLTTRSDYLTLIKSNENDIENDTTYY